MGRLGDLGPPARTAQLLQGTCVEPVPSSVADPLFVNITSFGGESHTWGPVPYTAHGSSVPRAGDAVLLAIDETGSPWVVMWGVEAGGDGVRSGLSLADLPASGGGSGGGGPATPVASDGISRITYFGNSFGEGGTLSINGLDRAARFALTAAYQLGAAELNYCKDGAILVQNSDSAAWRATLVRLKPYKADGVTLINPTEAGEWTGPAGGEVTVLCRNFNDQIYLGADQDIFIETLRAEAVRARTCVWWGVADAGWAYGGGAGAQTADAGSTDGPFRRLGLGGWAERTIPAHFPGAWVHFLSINGAGVVGSDYTVTLNGTPILSTAMPSKYALFPTYTFPTVRRFFIPAGGGTLRITGSGAAGGTLTAFNGVGVEDPSPGLVVLCAGLRVLPGGVAFWGANADPAITASQAAAMRAMAAEFTDSLVAVWDMDAVMAQNPALYNPSDFLHPSNLGHQALGTDLATLIARNLPARRRRATDRFLNIGDPDGFYTGSTIGSGVVQFFPSVFTPAGFRRDGDGTVHLRGFLQKTADPGAGVNTVLATLPVVMWPVEYEVFNAIASDGTTRGGCSVQVGPDGTITALPPSAATKHQFGASSWISLGGISYKAQT